MVNKFSLKKILLVFLILGAVLFIAGFSLTKNSKTESVSSTKVTGTPSVSQELLSVTPSPPPTTVLKKPFFISPKDGQEVVEGKNYPVELFVQNPTEVARVEFGMGNLNSPSNLFSLGSPPFKYTQKIPDPANISPYLAQGGGAYFVALISYKNGNKESVSVKLKVASPKSSIWFVQPDQGRVFHPDEKINIQAGYNTPGNSISKVEFSVACQVIQTFSSPPYFFEYDLKNYCGGMQEQVVPLGVKATLSNGETITDSRDVGCKI